MLSKSTIFTRPWKGIIDCYRTYLPVTDKTPIITLNEGNTPLIFAPHITKLCNIPGFAVYLKVEGANPTGSFKDRGMTVAVSKAIEEKSKAIICASTGNTSASAAAYAARARANGYKMDCFVLVPKGYVALGKLSQAMIYGAKVIQVAGNFDEALRLVREIAEKYPVTLVNSVNPYRIEGQKTGAFEVCEQLGRTPDILSIPVGNAGNITAYWKGFCEYIKNDNRPKMIGFEASGAAPIVQNKIIEKPETIATAIRIGNPASWKQAVSAAQESGGFIDMVTDEEIINAYKLLHQSEGIACEPASAASVAGLIKSAKANKILPESTVVCVLTGNGLKDPDSAIKYSEQEKIEVKPDLKEIAKMLTL
ncbi:MAG: threonine synthase [Candidatus Melainabacteria bacterium RIFCSPLOWO2_02_FULL_35_15]|nr:MAG: threonine synthase [Candidatus Melainabacteria bacterium RIFCSPLOWO2_12_FULL_35_11]OGI13804.1 MAG: threonine synthase [Candidatus Melainabacteria bacterium RIFCSPLOWO2_02_FULL_35_15]